MKELDLVLVRFLRERWPAATADERATFERILELPDPVLAGYLMGHEDPDDACMAALISILRGSVPQPVGRSPGQVAAGKPQP